MESEHNPSVLSQNHSTLQVGLLGDCHQFGGLWLSSRFVLSCVTLRLQESFLQTHLSQLGFLLTALPYPFKMGVRTDLGP